jgi:small nuclear ribonucleoprotein (snRNP)-like protein
MLHLVSNHHHHGLSSQAYDQHLNMVLGDVEETITSVEIDDETYEEIIKVPPLWPAVKLTQSARAPRQKMYEA